MDQFQRTGDRHQSRRGLPNRFCRGNGQDRADSLPPAMRLYRMLSWSVVGAVVELGMTKSRNRSTSSRFCSR